MSDNNDTGAKGSTSSFSERELQLLGWAMQSLKSGPPEIDYEKLAAFAGMSNPRSAGNAWAKIKGKLMTPTDGSAPSPTPKKAAGGRKKATPAVGEDGEPVTPKKTPRKRVAKKQEVDGEDASPKKKGRAVKKSDEVVKEESDESEELKPNGTALVGAETEIDEENIEAEMEI